MLATVSLLGRFNVSAREGQRHVILLDHGNCRVLAGVDAHTSVAHSLAEATSAAHAAHPNPDPMHPQFMSSLCLLSILQC